MTTGRAGRGALGNNTRRRRAPKAPHVRLAPGVRLEAEDATLVCPEGRVHVNSGATAILRLCDGSRDAQTIVAELTHRSHRDALADEIAEFLRAARARGWITEA